MRLEDLRPRSAPNASGNRLAVATDQVGERPAAAVRRVNFLDQEEASALALRAARLLSTRRLPKRGFNNKFKVECAVVNIADLEERFSAGDVVTVEALKELGWCAATMSR